MKAISGCFRTTPTDVLQYETQLPPVNLELCKQVQKYLTHIQTLPDKHPVANCMRRAKQFRERNQTRTHLSNLEHLIIKYPELVSENMETILAYVRPPWWNPTNITININHVNKEQAKRDHEISLQEHAKNPRTMCIYTDGSGIEGSVAAATYSTTTYAKTHQYLGEEQTTNVYAAELTGVQLAMTTTIEHGLPQYQKCVIYADNQSAVSAILKPERQSGQYILRDIHKLLDKSLDLEPNLLYHIEWVPGHMDIHSNDKADEEAKRAAKEKIQGDPPINVYKLKSALNMVINTHTANEIKAIWNLESITNKRYRRFT